MYHFEYVTKKELAPIRAALENLIHIVQDDIRDEFTFQYKFIGSSKRNMVTYDHKSNVGFDFDINIEINDEEEIYSPDEIKHILMNSFDKSIKRMNNIHTTPFSNIVHSYRNINRNYDYCEDSTRVFTIKVKDREHSKILYSCDFAVVRNYGHNQQEYIKFNKQENEYVWENQPKGFYKLPDKIDFCKNNSSLWNKVREIYLNKKNTNCDKNKKSRSLFAETVNEVCRQNGYYKKKE